MRDKSYIERQEQRDREYHEAWKNAPESFKQKAADLGLVDETDENPSLDVREFDDNFISTSTMPDMAFTLDTHIDYVIEKLGIENIALIRMVAEELKIPMQEEITRASANLLGRIAGYLIYMQNEKGNNLARIHALLHAMPRYAAEAGFPSMRSSAKACGVSPEWLRRKRDQWCALLGIDPPATGIKSPEAKKKYKKNALNNHWRNQKYTKKKFQRKL